MGIDDRAPAIGELMNLAIGLQEVLEAHHPPGLFSAGECQICAEYAPRICALSEQSKAAIEELLTVVTGGTDAAPQ